MKRVVVPLLLGVGVFLLALWLTRDPTGTAPEVPAVGPAPLQEAEATGPALHGTGPSSAAPADLADRFTLRGLVVDEEDQPLAGVLVRCLHAPQRARARDAVWGSFELALRGHEVRTPVGAAVRTGNDGRFGIPGLLVAEQYHCHLLPEAPWAESSRYVRTSRAGVYEMRFVLRSGAAIRGRVVDADGRGLQAFVSASGDVGAPLLHGLPPRETDPDGRFGIAALPDGRWSFTVAVPGRGRRVGITVEMPTSGEVVLPFRLADGATIAGRVTQGEDRPVEGARVLATLRGRGAGQELYVMALATTDAAGRYRLEGLDPGRIEGIAVEAEGFATLSDLYGGFPLRTGGVLEADVLLASGTVIEGRVLDAEGRAVPGAFVRLRIQLPSRGPFPSSARRRTTTDAQGRYRFERLLPVGTGTLDAGTQDAWTPPASAGSADPVFDLEREGPVIERDLVLAPVPRVRGLVVDAEGRPVAGALVSAEGSGWRGPAGAGRAPPRALSGGDGGFALAGTAPGETWTLEARTATLRSEPLPALRIPHPPEPAPEVRLVLRPTASLRGRVSRPDGSAWAGTQVVLNPEDSARRGSLTANTDEEGRFVFDGLRAGRYQLPMHRWDGEEGSAPQRFELAWGQVVEGVTVVREPARTITGIVVTPQDEPVPRAVVEFQRQGSTDHRSRGVDTARADGRFELHVAPGTYDVWVRGGDTPITVEAGATDVTLRTTVPPVREVFGTVVDDAGRPVPRAKVTLWVHEGTSLSGRGAACTMGRFHASLETAMSTADVVVEDARDAAGRPLNLQPGAWHGVYLDGGEELRCRLEPGLVVEGRVVDAAGRGVSNVSIRCRLAAHDTSWLGGLGEHVALPRVRTDDTGRFAFIGLGSEPLQLTVEPTSPWIPPPPTHVVPGVAGPLEIRLERGHALGGHVRGEDGRPVAGARVRVRWAADEPGSDGQRAAEGRTDEEGRFHLARVGPGPLTVAIEGAWSEPWPYRPFVAESVEPGTLDLDLRLERGSDLTGVVVDPEGNPVVSGSVSIWRRREGRAPTHHVVGVDERGRFVVPELEPGIYELVGSGDSEFAPTERTVVHAPAQDVRLVLGRTWLLHGTVVGRPDVAKQVHFLYHEDGEPRLEGIGYGDGGPFSFRVRTDRPGTLLLTIEETGEYALLENVRPGSGPHRLVPAPAAAIEGRIDGGPVDAGDHQVSGIDARGIRIRTRTEADGTFRITGVPPGAYRLEAWVPRDGQYLQYAAEGVEAGAKDAVLHRVP